MGASELKRELKKRGPFESPQQEAAINVLRTNDRLQIRFARLFRQYELTPSQYNVLRILRGEGKPIPILEIASRTITVVPGITGLVDRLEQAGFVARERCAEDRRVVYVSLTKRGAKTLAEIDKPLAELHRQALRGLTAAETRELSRLLTKLRRGLADA